MVHKALYRKLKFDGKRMSFEQVSSSFPTSCIRRDTLAKNPFGDKPLKEKEGSEDKCNLSFVITDM